VHGELIKFLENAGTPEIGVVGDLMLDRYLWGAAERISPEAPVPVVDIDRSRTYTTVGGAGSVIRDLVALGARVWAAGIVGDDSPGAEIIAKLEAEGVDCSGVLVLKDRQTTRKTRILSRTQQVMRIDEEESRPPEAAQIDRIRKHAAAMLPPTGCLVLSDYIPQRGILSRELIAALTGAARKAGVPVWADPARGRNFLDFKGVSAVTPNRRETGEATGIIIEPGTLPETAADWLIEKLDLDLAVITLDVEGLYYRFREGQGALIPARTRGAYDVTGAGDMIIAAAAFAVAGGARERQALELANFAAGIEVERLGVVPIGRAEILRRLKAQAHGGSDKVMEIAHLKPILADRRRRGDKIVFTNGCFDLLHGGHVHFLEFARRQGDLLVVGLNSDESVRRLKGPGRPVLSQDERATILAALAAVDFVTIFDEDTPAALIKSLLPDILVKGEDWRDKGVVGRQTVESRGGSVVLAPLVPEKSTTDVIARIRDARQGGKSGGQD